MKGNSAQIGFFGVCESIQGPLPKNTESNKLNFSPSLFISTVQKSRCKMPKSISIPKKGETFGNKAVLKKSALIKKSKLLEILQQE